jgi:heme/copper-type cytochrome/quinol oxidase subunit 2
VTRHRLAFAAAALVGGLALSACTTSSPGGDSTSATSASSPAPGAATPSSASATVVRVTIRGKNVSPAPGDVNVPVGTTLRLIVTSDHDDQLHAHGFDVEVTLTAGRPTTLDLRATTPGTYEIETHHPPLTLMHVVVR